VPDVSFAQPKLDQRLWSRLRRAAGYYRPLACALTHQPQRADVHGIGGEYLGSDSVRVRHGGNPEAHVFFWPAW